MSHQQTITDTIKRYRKHLFIAVVTTLIVENIALMFGLAQLHHQWNAVLIYLLVSISLLPLMIIVTWERCAASNIHTHLARRLKLKPQQTIEFEQSMGLLQSDSQNVSIFTRQLLDRALLPWLVPITQACLIKGKLIVLITVQLISVVLLIMVCHLQNSETQSAAMTFPKDTINSEIHEASNDTQIQPSVKDALAFDLLAMRNQLDSITDEMSDAQLQQVTQQLNTLWQGITTAWQTLAQNQQVSDTQPQIASHMPMTGTQSLSSNVMRKAMADSLTKDINTLAKLGARFDGPGMISRGKSNQADNIAATDAQGRYDEYIDRKYDVTTKSVDRQMNQVPPAYRKAVAAFMAGTADSSNKGP